MNNSIRLARTCYRHLAGRLGVELAEALVARGLLDAQSEGFALTAAGARAFAELGLCLPPARGRRTILARRCLDCTERRPHVGGALGAALARHCFEQGWLVRVEDSRALRVTPHGREELRRVFGVGA
ncbi:hypothetical protein EPN52_09210 [bacterium]|nr:MAG: hypothetical protein EPN52_09210 [bacterium]